MGNIIVSSKEVAAAALREGLVGQKDLPELGAYLKAYDLALDGRQDGGFSRNQIKKDVYLTVPASLQKKDAQFGQKANRLIATLLEKKAQYQTAHPTFSSNDSILETGAKILGAILFAPFGCGYSGESSNSTTCSSTTSSAPTVSPEPVRPWCDKQECISSNQYRCDRPDGKKIVVSCPPEEQCEKGKCVTRPDYVDPTCGRGVRSVCEVTDELDFEPAQYCPGNYQKSNNLVFNCFQSYGRNDCWCDYAYKCFQASQPYEVPFPYSCGEDKALFLYGIHKNCDQRDPRFTENSWAAWNMKVLPPPLASHYRLDFKKDFGSMPRYDGKQEGCGGPPSTSMIIQFGDSQRQTIPRSSLWQRCVYQTMAVFSPDGVEDESIRIQVWNGGLGILGCTGTDYYPDPGSSVLALAKTRIWSCSCQQ